MLDKNTLTKLKHYVEEQLSGLNAEIHEEVYHLEEVSLAREKLDDYIADKQQPKFNEVLFQFIDTKETTDVLIYKKAWIDRKHFSKIRSNPDYQVGKNTAIALAMALELTENEAEELLQSAGYALSDSDKSDLIIQFCLENKIYDLHAVNEALDSMDEKTIGTIN